MKQLGPGDRRELRQFGLALTAMFPLAFWAILPWLFSHPRPLWPWLVAGVFALLALAWPRGLYPVYVAWMRVAGILGIVTNTIVLGTVFFLIMAPLGFVLRRLGKLQYRTGFDERLDSYRVSERRKPSADDLRNPF